MLPSLIILGSLGVLFGFGLFVASKLFFVKIDPRVGQIADVLPGANCGACGLAGCSGFAKAIVHGSADVTGCIPGGDEIAHLIADVMGVEATVHDKQVAVLKCQGRNVEDRYDYQGIPTCLGSSQTQGGHKACTYGCLQFGDCRRACPFDAIKMVDGFPVVIEELCTACGNCLKACPRDLFELHTLGKLVHVACKSYDKAKDVMKVCKVGCIGCKKCEKVCKFDAIKIDNFLSEIDYEKCTSCGLCVKACPTASIENFRKARKEIGLWPVKKND